MVIYRNAQWVVQEDGICPDEGLPQYDIEISRVFETTQRGDHTFYDWPVHMAEKTWVDARLFNEAFDRAIHHYSNVSGVPVDKDMLRASFAEALRIARSS
ncbi:MAG: hypothetical protein KF769_10290 [Parvibaculum sp.]|nr:hypothetical protein [Parvibaculum sp.]MCW5604193.1 hypothetical protein [Burkholderiales bacterium]